MAARCFRHILNDKWRQQVWANRAKNVHQEALRVLNMLVSEGVTVHDSSDSEFWKVELIPAVQKRYGVTLKFLRVGMGRTSESDVPLKLKRVHPTCRDVPEAPLVYPMPIRVTEVKAKPWGSIERPPKPLYEHTPPITVQRIKQTAVNVTPEQAQHRIFLHSLLERACEISGISHVQYSSFTGLHFVIESRVKSATMSVMHPAHKLILERRWNDAEGLILSELRWKRKQWQGSSVGDLKAIPVFRALIQLYVIWGRKDAAMEQIRKCLDIIRKEFPTNPIPCAAAEYAMARVLTTLKEFRLAERVLVSALTSSEELYKNSVVLWSMRALLSDICMRLPAGTLSGGTDEEKPGVGSATSLGSAPSLIGNIPECTRILRSCQLGFEGFHLPAAHLVARQYLAALFQGESPAEVTEKLIAVLPELKAAYYDDCHPEMMRFAILVVLFRHDTRTFRSLLPYVHQSLALDGFEFREVIGLRFYVKPPTAAKSIELSLAWLGAQLDALKDEPDSLLWCPRVISSVETILDSLYTVFKTIGDTEEGLQLLMSFDDLIQEKVGPRSPIRIGVQRQIGLWYLRRILEGSYPSSTAALCSKCQKLESAVRHMFVVAQIEGSMYASQNTRTEAQAFDISVLAQELLLSPMPLNAILLTTYSTQGIKVQNTVTATNNSTLASKEESDATPAENAFCVTQEITMADIDSTIMTIQGRFLQLYDDTARAIEDVDVLLVEKHWKVSSDLWLELFLIQARRHGLDTAAATLTHLEWGIYTLKRFIHVSSGKLGSYNNVSHYQKLLDAYNIRLAELKDQAEEIARIQALEAKALTEPTRRGRAGSISINVTGFSTSHQHTNKKAMTLSNEGSERSKVSSLRSIFPKEQLPLSDSYFRVSPANDVAPGHPLSISWKLPGAPAIEHAWLGLFRGNEVEEERTMVRFTRFDVRRRQGSIQDVPVLNAPLVPGDYTIGFSVTYRAHPLPGMWHNFSVLNIPAYRAKKEKKVLSPILSSIEDVPMRSPPVGSPLKLMGTTPPLKLPAVTVPFDTKASEQRRQLVHAIKFAKDNNLTTPTPIKFGRKTFQSKQSSHCGPRSFVIMDDGKKVEEESFGEH